MNVFELAARISLDTSGFEENLNNAKGIAEKFGSAVKGGFQTIAQVGTAAIGVASTAVVGFAKSSLDAGISFDSAMSQVAATMGKTVDEIQELRDFAQEMGATTAFSATQAAEALNYMALAGYGTEQSMSMLPTVLDLAAAGGMDLALASDMITDSQSALGLTMEETAELVDKMAKASSKTNTSVSGLGDAILTVGGTAKNLSGGTTELTQVLGLLADNGIKASESGTHLRNIMLAMTPTTDSAAAAFERLGLETYDTSGSLRSFEDIFLDMSAAMEGMTDKEKQDIITSIFNKTDLASVNALLSTTKDRWDEVAAAIEDSEGAAQAMASTQLDNLAGDITILKSAFEGLQIAVSDSVSPAFRDMVQLATDGLSSLTHVFEGGDLSSAVAIFQVHIADWLNNKTEQLPLALEKGKSIVEGIIKGIEKGFPAIERAASKLVSFLIDNAIKSIPNNIQRITNIISSIANIIIENGDEFIDAGSQILVSIVTGINNVVANITKAVPKIISLGSKIGSTLFKVVIDNLPQLFKTGTQLINEIINGVVEYLPEIITAAFQIVETVGKGIFQMLPILGNAALEIILTLADFLTENLPTMIPEIVGIVLEIVDTLTNPDTLGTLIDAAIAIIMALVDGLLSPDTLDKLVAEMPVIVQNIVDGIVENVPKLLEAAIEIIAALGGYLTDSNNLQDILNAALYIVDTLVVGIGDLLWKVTDIAWQIAGEIADTIGLGEYWETGAQVIEDFMGGVKEAWNNYTAWWADFWEYVGQGIINPGGEYKKKYSDYYDESGNPIPQFATGGIVRKPTLAVVGEAGPEAIVPLANNTQWIESVAGRMNNAVSGAGLTVQNLNINMEGMSISSDYDTDRFVERISEKLEVLSRREYSGIGGTNLR